MPLAGTGPILGDAIHAVIVAAHQQTGGIDSVDARQMWENIGTVIVNHIIANAAVSIGDIQPPPPATGVDWQHSHTTNTNLNRIL